MELRLLSADVDDLVDPDVDTIRGVLTKLPELSGDKPPRAVLVHDNGKDFIQFFAVFGKEITTGRPTESCHLQYCEHHEGKPSCFYSEEADFKKAVTIMLAYAKNLGWEATVAWEPLEYERAWWYVGGGVALSIAGIAFACLSLMTEVDAFAFVVFCFFLAGLCFSKEFDSLGRYGVPWKAGGGPGSYTSGTSGSCDSGDGGGRGQGYEESGGEQIPPVPPPPPPD